MQKNKLFVLTKDRNTQLSPQIFSFFHAAQKTSHVVYDFVVKDMSRKHLKKHCNLYLFPNLNILLIHFPIWSSVEERFNIHLCNQDFPKKCLRKNYVEENSVILILVKYERMRVLFCSFRVIEVLWSSAVAVVVRVLHPFSLFVVSWVLTFSFVAPIYARWVPALSHRFSLCISPCYICPQCLSCCFIVVRSCIPFLFSISLLQKTLHNVQTLMWRH